MSNPIFKIAGTNGNVLTDAQKDLVFDSSLDYMIILEERTDVSDGSGNLTISHGLGYPPAFYTFFSNGSGTWYRQLQSGLGGAYADTNNIYITTDSPSQSVRTVIFANSQDNAIGTGRNNAFGKLKMSKPTYNASTDTDLRRFVFASGNGIFKIKENKVLTVTVNLDGSGYSNDTVSYAHGLSYIPQVYVFLGGQQLPQFHFIAAGQSYSVDFSVDSTNVNVNVSSGQYALLNGDTFVFNVQILMDKIA